MQLYKLLFLKINSTVSICLNSNKNIENKTSSEITKIEIYNSKKQIYRIQQSNENTIENNYIQ